MKMSSHSSSRQSATRLTATQEERQIHRETMAEFLARGGKITRCDAKRATQTLDGAAVIDGMTISIITGGSEAIPQFTRATVEHYDKGMRDAIRPYHHLAWHDIERESMPSDARRSMEYVTHDADDHEEMVTW
jgi:hypothetical protein